MTQVPSAPKDNTEESNILLDDEDWYTNMMKKIKGDHKAEQEEMSNVLSIVNKPQNDLYPDLEPVDIFRTFKVTTRDRV